MDYGTLWAEVAQAALNYIVVQTITNISSQKTVSDLKTDLRTTKEDLMAELKETRAMLEKEIENGERKGV